jgi:hypothetical protein
MIRASQHIFYKGVLLLLFTMAGLSCERLDGIIIDGFDCSNCYQEKPEFVQLNVFVTLDSENPFVPLTIYVGDVEDNNIDWEDTTYNKSYWVDVIPGRYYSVKAEYKDGSKKIFAIDGDDVKLKENTTDCDVPCYYQVGGYVDVRLN